MKLKILSNFLFAPQMPLWRYCLLAFLLAFVPTTILAVLVISALKLAGVDFPTLAPPARAATASSAILLMLVAPLLETFVLAVGLHILLWLSKRRGFVATASAALWGGAHALGGVLAFVGTTWSFFVMSCGYLAWHERDPAKAFAAAAVPHLLNNAVVFLALALLRPA